MRVLITGITGLAGRHLFDLLTAREGEGCEIYGTYFKSDSSLSANYPGASLRMCDLTDAVQVDEAVAEAKPDRIYHLGAFVSVKKSFDMAPLAVHTNVTGTVNLLESTRKHCPDTRILLSGSAEEYGKVSASDLPIRESASLRPVNPYGLSKMLQEGVGTYYCRMHGLKVVFTRTFFYMGPYQPLGFVFSDFSRQVLEVGRGNQGEISVGNLEARRDFTDIRDIVRAYAMLMESGEAGEAYNVCTGKSIAIKDILDKIIVASGARVPVVVDGAKLRPAEVPDFVGDNSKLKAATGWEPRHTLESSIVDILAYWERGGR